jgi:hypothetical protein
MQCGNVQYGNVPMVKNEPPPMVYDLLYKDSDGGSANFFGLNLQAQHPSCSMLSEFPLPSSPLPISIADNSRQVLNVGSV